jgi:hypothetical protein
MQNARVQGMETVVGSNIITPGGSSSVLCSNGH